MDQQRLTRLQFGRQQSTERHQEGAQCTPLQRLVWIDPSQRRHIFGRHPDERAGISTDWYVRLEQGRTVSPSNTTVDALARALELNAQEHAYLRTLAGHAPARGFVRE